MVFDQSIDSSCFFGSIITKKTTNMKIFLFSLFRKVAVEAKRILTTSVVESRVFPAIRLFIRYFLLM